MLITNRRCPSVLGQFLLVVCLIVLAAGASAGEDSHANTSHSSAPNSPAQKTEALKQQVLELNRDLLLLEEDLLYPASSQVALYLSMDVGHYFALDAVKVKIDGEFVTSDLYTAKQVDALFRGGVQKLYLGNIKTGEHQISAFFTGMGPHNQPYKRAASITVNKTTKPIVLELRIVDSTGKLQPVFDIKKWSL